MTKGLDLSDPLADDPAALRARIAELEAERDEARRRRDEWRKKAEGYDAVRKALREKVGAPWPPNLSRALWAGIAADEKKRADDAEAQVAALHRALAAVGATPHGFCCCPGRDATKPEEAHVGECREARAVLRDAEGVAADVGLADERRGEPEVAWEDVQETLALRARIAGLEEALNVVLDDLMYRDHQRVIDFARAALSGSTASAEAIRREALEEAAYAAYGIPEYVRGDFATDERGQLKPGSPYDRGRYEAAAAIRALAEKGDQDA